MQLKVGDIITIDSSNCADAVEIVYLGPALICACFLMNSRHVTTHGYDINVKEFLYRKGDETMEMTKPTPSNSHGVELYTCNKCNKRSKSF